MQLEVVAPKGIQFEDVSFDRVLVTFAFRCVPDPARWLREAGRVLVPGGQLLLVEHVLSLHGVLHPLVQFVNPAVVRAMGANINRDTIGNVAQAGFEL